MWRLCPTHPIWPDPQSPQLPLDARPARWIARLGVTMATNRWQIGALYYPGGPPPTSYFTQPGGIGSKVYPTQKNAEPWPDFPVPGMIINEYVPWWSPNCGHSISEWLIIREYDYDENVDCALICCRVCSYCQAVYRPFSSWLNPIEHAIIVA